MTVPVDGTGPGVAVAPADRASVHDEQLALDEGPGDGSPSLCQYASQRCARDPHPFGRGLLVEPLQVHETQGLESVERQFQ
jgi:hypothetical protein